MFNNFVLLENISVYENLEKYCRAGQVTDDNMEHEHCMLDTEGYKPHSEYVTHCFSTATVVARTRTRP